jgi:hypothetical protein
VFTTIARELRRHHDQPEEAMRALEEVAGFRALNRTLKEHFLERAQLLRSFRLVRDAQAALRSIWYAEILPSIRSATSERQRLERFIRYAKAADADAEVELELLGYLHDQLADVQRRVDLEPAWRRVEDELGSFARNLSEYNADFSALLELGDGEGFTQDEVAELRALLGMYGFDPTTRLAGDISVKECVKRQVRWRVIRDQSRRASRRWNIADRAHDRLGLIISDRHTAGTPAVASAR